jgi:uncharacterized protein (TIGR02300 family)
VVSIKQKAGHPAISRQRGAASKFTFDRKPCRPYWDRLVFSPVDSRSGGTPTLIGHSHEAFTVAKAELGTKRTDPDTGKKFYDLNRDPVVSPYSGKSWPLSFFEENTAQMKMEQAEEEEVQEVDTENQEVELVASDDSDDAASGDDVPDDIGDDDVELEADDDDTFLEADEDDDDDDMSGIIGVTGDDDEV